MSENIELSDNEERVLLGQWFVTTWLPADVQVECKLALVSPGPGYVLWETGGNKYVPGRGCDGTVELEWGRETVRTKTQPLPKQLGTCVCVCACVCVCVCVCVWSWSGDGRRCAPRHSRSRNNLVRVRV